MACTTGCHVEGSYWHNTHSDHRTYSCAWINANVIDGFRHADIGFEDERQPNRDVAAPKTVRLPQGAAAHQRWKMTRPVRPSRQRRQRSKATECRSYETHQRSKVTPRPGAHQRSKMTQPGSHPAACHRSQ